MKTQIVLTVDGDKIIEAIVKSLEEVSKPEITGEYVHIPVNDCKITATIDIDKEKGIKALYCGGKEKQIATYLFPKDKYSMDEAKNWVKEHESSKADWDVKYQNDLKDSAFAFIRDGGEKDEGGKTVPRQLRFLPYKDKDGNIDLPHLRNALARLSQTDLTPVEQTKARKVLEAAARSENVGEYAEKGGEGSGNFGHEGRPREVGGSGPGGGGGNGGGGNGNGNNGGEPLTEEDVKEYTKKSAKDYFVPIIKADEEKRLIYGIVMEPDSVDSQGDKTTAEEIEKAAHKFMLNSQIIYNEHEKPEPDCNVVESYICPQNIKMGESDIKKGSWVMVTHCAKDELWEQVKKGGFTGYSIKGFAQRS